MRVQVHVAINLFGETLVSPYLSFDPLAYNSAVFHIIALLVHAFAQIAEFGRSQSNLSGWKLVDIKGRRAQPARPHQ